MTRTCLRRLCYYPVTLGMLTFSLFAIAPAATAQTTGGVPNQITAPGPSMPPSNASVAEWARWSALQATFVRSQPVVPETGCTTRTTMYFPTVPAIPAPAGVKGTGRATIQDCATNLSLAASSATPGSRPNFGTGSNCAGSQGPGTICISPRVTGLYQYTGYGSIQGDVQIGNLGAFNNNCGHYNIVAAPPRGTLYHNQIYRTDYYPGPYSSNWSSTFVSLGNVFVSVCGSY